MTSERRGGHNVSEESIPYLSLLSYFPLLIQYSSTVCVSGQVC